MTSLVRISVRIPEKQKALIKKSIKKGDYVTQSEVVRAGLNLLFADEVKDGKNGGRKYEHGEKRS